MTHAPFCYTNHINHTHSTTLPHHQVEAAASSAVKMGCDIGAKAIIVLSQTGETARLLAKFHPNALILSVSADAQVQTTQTNNGSIKEGPDQTRAYRVHVTDRHSAPTATLSQSVLFA